MSRAEVVGIVGAGRFGTALANRLALAGRPVVMWSSDEEVVRQVRQRRVNPRLPEVELAASLTVTADAAELAASARFLLLAVASVDVRARLRALGDVVDGSHFVVHAIGALASPGEARVSEVIAEETPVRRIGALAGPALYRDLVGGAFSSMVVASAFAEVTREARRLLSLSPALRIYCSTDLVGVELAAALSGAYTVAIGVADALQIGAGPKAVLITRGLAEASRLGEAAGGDARTFTGLAGLGNLLVRSSSSSSEYSRDYRLGLALGEGRAPTDGDRSEGAGAAIGLARLADRLGVRMPLLSAIAAVVRGEASPRAAAAAAADSVAEQE